MSYKKLFTSESVSEGHPDKICDQISDAVLDACLTQDSHSRVSCNLFITADQILIGGEITTNAKINFNEIIQTVFDDIGYKITLNKTPSIKNERHNFQTNISVHQQSPEIHKMVNNLDHHMKYGDQGIVFGYAVNETDNYLPIAYTLANELLKRATYLRKNDQFHKALPDMKSQVTVRYTDNPSCPIQVEKVVLSINHYQHDSNETRDQFRHFINTEIIDHVLRQFNLNIDCEKYINNNGDFVLGGPWADSGLSNKKIVVDTYGGGGRCGGGGLSGKDPTKPDRSGNYLARYIAKNIVATGLINKLEIQLSFLIGSESPIAVAADTFHHAKVTEAMILQIIAQHFDLTLQGFINDLKLLRPIYRQTSVGGHFSNATFPWEATDKTSAIKKTLLTLIGS